MRRGRCASLIIICPCQTGGTTYVVIDTNVLISHLPTVKALHALLAHHPAPDQPIRLLIPNTVIRELDKHKAAFSPSALHAERMGTGAAGAGESVHARPTGISAIARAAGDWLLALGRRARERKAGDEVLVRCQRMDEVYARGVVSVKVGMRLGTRPD